MSYDKIKGFGLYTLKLLRRGFFLADLQSRASLFPAAGEVAINPTWGDYIGLR
jgi:hypothetical protein